MIFSKFKEFSVLRAIHPPETLIFLRNYWCFRDRTIFMKFLIFTKKAKVCEKIMKSAFPHFPARNDILRKKGPRAPETSKKGWNSIGFKGPGASGPHGTKKRGKLRKPRKISCVFDENSDFYVKSWKLLKNHRFAPSQNVGIPCGLLILFQILQSSAAFSSHWHQK